MIIYRSVLNFESNGPSDNVEARLDRFRNFFTGVTNQDQHFVYEGSLRDGTPYVSHSFDEEISGNHVTSHVLMTFEEQPKLFTLIEGDKAEGRIGLAGSPIEHALTTLHESELLTPGLKPFEYEDLVSGCASPERIFELLAVTERTFPIVICSDVFALDKPNIDRNTFTFAPLVSFSKRQIDQFNDLVGPAHSVPKKGLRIFCPAPKFSISRDSSRHPVVFEDEIETLGKLIWEKTKRSALPIPSIFEAEIPMLLGRALITRLGLRDTVLALKGQNQGLQVESMESLKAELDNASGRESALILEKNQIENELIGSMELIEKLNAKYKYAKARLAEFGDFVAGEIAEADKFWGVFPSSFSDIVELIPSTKYLIFTGSLEGVKWANEQVDIAPLQKCWNTLRSLEEYATSKATEDYARGYMDFLKDDSVDAFKVPSALISPREGEQVASNPDLYKHRVLPVPLEVSPDGFVYMQAHAKLRVTGGSAIRMHFYDDTANTGRIYIGHLGKHLPLP